MRFATFLFTLIFYVNVSGQTNIDSLTIVLNNALSNNDNLTAARISYKIGKLYDKQNKTSESNLFLKKALEYARKAGSSKAVAIITNYLAGNYSEQGKTNEAIDLYEKCYDLFISLNDSSNAANIYLNLGSEYLNKGEYDQALDKELKALKIKESINNSSNIAYFYQQISEVYKQLGMTKLWKNYLLKAKELSQKSGNAAFKTRIAILNDIADIESKENNKTKALDNYQEMYSLSKQNGYTRGMYIALSNMSNILLDKGEYRKALEMAEQAYEMALAGKNIYNLSALSNHIGNTYIKLKNTDKAKEWFYTAIRNSNNKYPDEIKRSYKGLYEANKIAGKHQDALTYLEKYIELKDSLDDIAVKNRVNELETIYQTEKKSARIKDLNQKNIIQSQKLKTQKLITGLIVLFILLLIVVVVFALRQYRLQVHNKEIMLQQRLLRSQMNPHFIFNSLGSIQNFMYSNETKKAAFYLGSFSSLMRAILEHSREEMITLDKEIETLNSFLQLQKMRLGFSYEVICSENIDEEFTLIPPMLIQPFVENAIKHGIKDMADEGMIKVDFTSKNNKLIVIIDDNGVGINFGSTPDKDHKSLAMKIFKERISFLSSYLKKEIVYKFIDKSETKSGGRGTKVILELPLIIE